MGEESVVGGDAGDVGHPPSRTGPLGSHSPLSVPVHKTRVELVAPEAGPEGAPGLWSWWVLGNVALSTERGSHVPDFLGPRVGFRSGPSDGECHGGPTG